MARTGGSDAAGSFSGSVGRLLSEQRGQSFIMRRTPDWNSILAVARDADARLSECARQGQRLRVIYWRTFRRACVFGYRGTQRDWQSFVRERGK